MENKKIHKKDYPVFKVVTRWPESYGRSVNGGDYELGCWLVPTEKGYQKRFYTSYEGGCCPATGAYNCPVCEEFESHDDGDFEYLDPIEVAEMLEKYPYRVVPRYRDTKQGLVCRGFYIEIDATAELP